MNEVWVVAITIAALGSALAAIFNSLAIRSLSRRFATAAGSASSAPFRASGDASTRRDPRDLEGRLVSHQPGQPADEHYVWVGVEDLHGTALGVIAHELPEDFRVCRACLVGLT